MIQKVLKRDNVTLVDYDSEKIKNAILKGNMKVPKDKRISIDDIQYIISLIEKEPSDDGVVKVEHIQNTIEKMLVDMNHYELAKEYITYRYRRALARKVNTTDGSMLSLIRNDNEEVQKENSNKKAILNSTKRDLIAGEVSKDLSRRYLLPENIIAAHDAGIIHFHDMDYFAQPEFNCCLPNFRDMLKNGTCINGVKINTPKSFSVACNQVTQIMAAISSNQYGGQTFYSDVLGEYLAYTREKIRKRIDETIRIQFGDVMPDAEVNKLIDTLVEEELQYELKAGVQTIQYQINTMCTSNGQSPFVTIFMYLREDDPYIEENAMIIEEILKQRLEGIENKAGVKSTPTFPKLVYVLSENNCLKGGKYDYLTHLAAKCTAKRIYPDYISEKVMKENYDGEVFGCMGCVGGEAKVLWKFNNRVFHTPIKQMWDILSKYFAVKEQWAHSYDNLYIDTLDDVKIYDTKKGFVKNKRIIRNKSHDWMFIRFENGEYIKATLDHPFETLNRGVVRADQITTDDVFLASKIKIGNKIPTYRKIKIQPIEIHRFYEDTYSYDVTTDSDHFEVNGIYSHNCRSFLSAWTDPTTGEKKWEGRFNQGRHICLYV